MLPRSEPTPLTVLYVEDDEGDIATLRDRLAHDCPYVVMIIARTLAEGLTTLRERLAEIQAVLLDLFLPDARNFEALETMRRVAPPQIPIVVYSGRVGPGLLDASTLLALGAAGVISKHDRSRDVCWSLREAVYDAGMRRAAGLMDELRRA